MKIFATLTASVVLFLNTAVAIPNMPEAKSDKRVLTFSLLTEGADVAAEHVPNYIGGNAIVSYVENKVILKFDMASQCRIGFACPAVLRMQVIELPIVNISASEDECATIVTASVDKRPADGLLKQITIQDFSNSKCQFYVKPISDVRYLTSFVNRMTGQDVTTVSTLKADLVDVQDVEPVGQYFNLSGGEYLKGFRKGEKVNSGGLIISENSVRLEIYNKSTCPPGAMCIVGPTTLIVDLQIESREFKGCAEVIKASVKRPGAHTEVVVKNYAHSPCDIMPEHLVTVDYTSSIVSPAVLGPTHVARFFFNYALDTFNK